MIPHNNPQVNQHILKRPRVNMLIREGLKYPLLVMLAGPGYGKTQAMVNYVKEYDAEVLWIRLGTIDNLPSRFWSRLILMLKQKYTHLNNRLEGLVFPNTIQDFDAFARVIEDAICGPQEVLWIFDDYGLIHNQQIKDFISMLAESNFKLFHLAILSNELNNIESIAFLTTKRALLLTDDLRFNRNEIREFYRLYGIRLEANDLELAERYTQGWPMSMCLLASQPDRITTLIRSGETITDYTLSQLFQERFFAAYWDYQQKLFLKLSLIDSFTKSFAAELCDGQSGNLDILKNHAFLIPEPNTNRFYFHYLYRSFLQEKRYLLTPEEEREFWSKAAEYYMTSGDTLEAISCYHKSGKHLSMLNAIHHAILSFDSINNKMEAYFLENIELLTEDELRQYPLADCIRATIYTCTYQLDKAEKLILDLEIRLFELGTEEALSLLGEAYIIHGLIRMMCAETNFGEYFKKAFHYLPDGSKFANTGGMKTGNHFSFFMSSNKVGAKDEVEYAIHDGVPWMTRLLGGSSKGMQHLFSAEVSYLSQRMEDAKQHAYRTIYEAESGNQYDLVCNAYVTLARIAFLQGDFQETSENIRNIVEYAKKCEIGVINEIRDTSLTWYYLEMRDFKHIPKSTLRLNHSNKAAFSFGRAYIIYADYLIAMGEYAKTIGLLEHLQNMVRYKYITQENICLHIMLAVSYSCLSNDRAAIQSFWIAYNMCHNNDLVTNFIEAEEYMIDLIHIARKQDEFIFSSEWLDFIEEETLAFIQRADTVRAAYMKQNPVKSAKDNPLSKRELLVLQSVAQGMTREEIALEQYISMNTVKSTISSIYNKLGANNKADAVAIAITHGYIDGFFLEY